MKKLFILLCVCVTSFGAVQFDGSDDSIDFGDVADIDTATSITIAAWVYHISDTSDDYVAAKGSAAEGFLMFRDDVGSVSGRTDCYTFLVSEDTAGTDLARIETATGSGTSGSWRHIAMTAEVASATGLRAYINGVEDANSPVSTSLVANFNGLTNPLRIGSSSAGGLYLEGRIADVRIYNRVLSAAEVAQLYNSRLKYHSNSNGLIHYWTLDDVPDGDFADGDTFRDRAGTANGTGNDGANNTGLTGKAETFLSYP